MWKSAALSLTASPPPLLLSAAASTTPDGEEHPFLSSFPARWFGSHCQYQGGLQLVAAGYAFESGWLGMYTDGQRQTSIAARCSAFISASR